MLLSLGCCWPSSLGVVEGGVQCVDFLQVNDGSFICRSLAEKEILIVEFSIRFFSFLHQRWHGCLKKNDKERHKKPPQSPERFYGHLFFFLSFSSIFFREISPLEVFFETTCRLFFLHLFLRSHRDLRHLVLCCTLRGFFPPCNFSRLVYSQSI
jgi:hypothetical protein